MKIEWRRRGLIAVVIWMLVMPYSTMAEEGSSDGLINKIKAAYIFKFGNYVQWPENAFKDISSPLVIGIADSDQVADELDQLSKRRLYQNRQVIIKRLSPSDAAPNVHILYIGNKATSFLKPLEAAYSDKPVLTVGDTQSLETPETIISFVMDDNKVRFDVNLTQAEMKNIKLDAGLLTVARKVIR